MEDQDTSSPCGPAATQLKLCFQAAVTPIHLGWTYRMDRPKPEWKFTTNELTADEGQVWGGGGQRCGGRGKGEGFLALHSPTQWRAFLGGALVPRVKAAEHTSSGCWFRKTSGEEEHSRRVRVAQPNLNIEQCSRHQPHRTFMKPRTVSEKELVGKNAQDVN